MHRETVSLVIVGIAILIVFTILWLMGEFWRNVAWSVIIIGYTSLLFYWQNSKPRGKE